MGGKFFEQTLTGDKPAQPILVIANRRDRNFDHVRRAILVIIDNGFPRGLFRIQRRAHPRNRSHIGRFALQERAKFFPSNVIERMAAHLDKLGVHPMDKAIRTGHDKSLLARSSLGREPLQNLWP